MHKAIKNVLNSLVIIRITFLFCLRNEYLYKKNVETRNKIIKRGDKTKPNIGKLSNYKK